jgi:hypothetical protein
MVQGETLMTGDAGCVVHSPWFEGCGSGATFAVEVGPRTSGKPTSGTLQILVETKNSEDADSERVTLERVDVPGFWFPFSATEEEEHGDSDYVSTARFTGFKELVRFKYVLAAIEPAKFFSVHFRMLPPLWEANCLGCSIEEKLERDVQMEA